MSNPIIDQLAAASTPDEVKSILDGAGIKVPEGAKGDAPPPGSPISGDVADEKETPDEAMMPGEEITEMSAESKVDGGPGGSGKAPPFPPKKKDKAEPSLREMKDAAAEKALKGKG